MSASCNPMDCSPPGSSLHGISQARILKWVAFPSPGDLTSQGANLHLLNWQADSLPLSHQGSPLGKTYWRAYIKWVEQRNVYSTEKKKDEDTGPSQGSTLGLTRPQRFVCMSDQGTQAQEPPCLFPTPTYGTEGTQLQKMEGPFQLGWSCLNSSSVDLQREGKQQEWYWLSLQPTVIGVQRGIQFGFLSNPR